MAPSASVRHKILYAFEVAARLSNAAQRRAWLTFVIVGAGPTGVELAGAIGEIARQTLRNDFRSIRPEEAQIVLLDGAPRLLTPFPEDLARKAEQSLARLGVQAKMGARVTQVDRDGVDLQINGSSERLFTKTVIWAGGVTVAPLGRILAKRTGAETDRQGRIKVGLNLTVANFSDIYIVGDLALSIDKNGQPLAGRSASCDAEDICRKSNHKKSARPTAAEAIRVL